MHWLLLEYIPHNESTNSCEGNRARMILLPSHLIISFLETTAVLGRPTGK